MHVCTYAPVYESVRSPSGRADGGRACAAMTAIDSVTYRIALQFAASKAAPVIGNFSVAAAHPLGQVTSGRPHRGCDQGGSTQL
jgi:hypothetical protein